MLIFPKREDFGGRLWIIPPRGGDYSFVEGLFLVFSMVGELLLVDGE